jgi:hypothetical protein
MKFDVLVAVNVPVTIYWGVAPWRPAAEMEAAGFSELLVPI